MISIIRTGAVVVLTVGLASQASGDLDLIKKSNDAFKTASLIVSSTATQSGDIEVNNNVAHVYVTVEQLRDYGRDHPRYPIGWVVHRST